MNAEATRTPREFRFYLPAEFGDRAQIRGTFTGYEWQPMTPPAEGSVEWTYCADETDGGDQYSFRFRSPTTGAWTESTDPTAGRYTQVFDLATKKHDLFAVLPRLPGRRASTAPAMTRGLRICECTLPGLGARWPGVDLDYVGSRSLAVRMHGAGLARRLRERNFSAVMLPIQASAADVRHFDWKFGYLVTGLGAIHSQFGDWDELRALFDEFHAEGILVIPDLILAHFADQSSDRAPYAIRSADERWLWFDRDAHRPVDFGTLMLRWEDPFVRRQVAEMLARFVGELGLRAFRFDFVDGVIRQYESRGVNYGAALLDEMKALLRERGLDAWCLSEAFATREHPSVLGFADVLYQPWVGFDCMKAALTTPDERTPGRFQKVRDGLYGATGERQPKATLGYALAHDEAGRDEGVLQNHRNDRGETVSVGGHLAQLVLDYAKRLPDWGAPPPAERLAFTADRVALLEGTALLGADFAAMTLGDFSDFLKLGSYDDADGWQLIWDVESHPDVERWCAETGLDDESVRRRIGDHAERMAGLRRIFAEQTPIDDVPPRPRTAVEVVGNDGDAAIVTWVRRPPHGEGRPLLVVANFSHWPHERLDVRLPVDLQGEWETIDASTTPGKAPARGAIFATDAQFKLTLPVGANTLCVLRRRDAS